MVVLVSPACWYLKGNAGFCFWGSAFDHTGYKSIMKLNSRNFGGRGDANDKAEVRWLFLFIFHSSLAPKFQRLC